MVANYSQEGVTIVVTITCFLSQLSGNNTPPSGTNGFDILNDRLNSVMAGSNNSSVFLQTLNSIAILQGSNSSIALVVGSIVGVSVVSVIIEPPTSSPTPEPPFGAASDKDSKWNDNNLYYLFIVVGFALVYLLYRLFYSRNNVLQASSDSNNADADAAVCLEEKDPLKATTAAATSASFEDQRLNISQNSVAIKIEPPLIEKPDADIHDNDNDYDYDARRNHEAFSSSLQGPSMLHAYDER